MLEITLTLDVLVSYHAVYCGTCRAAGCSSPDRHSNLLLRAPDVCFHLNSLQLTQEALKLYSG